jgi:cyclic pyranopterin phosphate synthase
LERLSAAFIRLRVRKLRITGGEPLVRRDVMRLVRALGGKIGQGLDELTLTTNGTQLDRFADELFAAGIRRINVSLDTLDPAKFARITRWGKLDKVLGGLRAAHDAGLTVKINTVALRGENEEELADMLAWCGAQGFDMTLIEAMPMGEIDVARADQYLPLSMVRARLRQRFTLDETDYATGGPARYYTVRDTGRRLGFITPMTHNFCEGCNRVRLTVTGTLYLCLGQDESADLRAVLRRDADDRALDEAIRDAVARKPKGHDFVIDRRRPQAAVARHMSVTGG